MPTSEATLIVTEGRPVGAEFLGALERTLGTRTENLVLKTSRTVLAPKIFRQCVYFLTAARIARRRKRWGTLIFFQQAIAFHYAGWPRLRRDPGPIAVTPLILRPRRGPWRALRERAARSFVGSPAIDGFMVFSSAEREAYARRFGPGLAPKLSFVPLAGNVSLSPASEAGRSGARPAEAGRRGYHFSGGTSNRDYATLFRAFAGLGEDLVVACSPRDIQGLVIPPRVEVDHNSIGERFLDLLRGADSVIIPLNAADYSSGQVVLIQAMRYGKPIIVTRSNSAADYVDDRSALFVRPGHADDVAACVRRLAAEPGLAPSLGRAAREAYEKNLTAAGFAERIAAIVRDAADRRARPSPGKKDK